MIQLPNLIDHLVLKLTNAYTNIWMYTNLSSIIYKSLVSSLIIPHPSDPGFPHPGYILYLYSCDQIHVLFVNNGDFLNRLYSMACKKL